MKIGEFQNLIVHLSNQAYIRYWLHWKLSSSFDRQMVLSIGQVDENNKFYYRRFENLDKELEEKGFEKIYLEKSIYYTVERED